MNKLCHGPLFLNEVQMNTDTKYAIQSIHYSKFDKGVL